MKCKAEVLKFRNILETATNFKTWYFNFLVIKNSWSTNRTKNQRSEESHKFGLKKKTTLPENADEFFKSTNRGKKTQEINLLEPLLPNPKIKMLEGTSKTKFLV